MDKGSQNLSKSPTLLFSKVMRTFSAPLRVLSVLLVSMLFAGYLFADKEIKPGSNEKRVAKMVAKCIAQRHYSPIKVDDELSKTLYKEFFATLDPGKYYFYAEDIESFNIYQTQLDDLLIQGDTRFAYLVFALFKKRVEERFEFINKRIDQPFDYTVDETLDLDRKETSWSVSKTALDELWRKRVKNRLLSYILTDEMIEKNKTRKDLTEDEKKTLADQKKFPRKCPVERVKKYYQMSQSRYDSFDRTKILETYLTTFTKIFDPHSTYMSAETMEDFRISMSLKLKGIGATLSEKDGYIKVVKLVKGGPADLQGHLESGDRIIGVRTGDKGEEVDIRDMPISEAVTYIRGEKGTTVHLSVIKGDKGIGSLPVIISIVRDEVKLTESEAKGKIKTLKRSQLTESMKKSLGLKSDAVDNREYKVGVITIPSFYADFRAVMMRDPNAKTLTSDVTKILDDMKEKKIDGLIIDLRTNGGGSLAESINLTGLFIPSGPVVLIGVKKGAEPEVQRDRDGGHCYYDGPLVVMVNKFSASASEIFAGAIQDYHRGVIVGDKKTHGKGTVQTVYDLEREAGMSRIYSFPNPGTLKFTIQKFYRITGASTQKKGVSSDIVFPSPTDYMDSGEEKLDHVLPWDEVTPSKYHYFKDISNFIAPLTQSSVARRNASKEWVVLEKDIEEFAAREKNQMLSLNKAVRIAEHDKAKAHSKKLEKLFSSDNEEDKEQKDIYLDETVEILSDLILLKESQGNKKAELSK